MEKKIYIAYGCNLDREGMLFRCPDSEFIDSGYLLNYELIFKGCASIREKKGSRVPVAIYRISENDEKYLDNMEGYPSYYDKKEVEVESINKENFKGMVYIMNDCYPEDVPYIGYFNGIKQSYRELNFDLTILVNAYKNAKRSYKRK